MIQKFQKIQKWKTFTEEINKTALKSNDDKRVQSIDFVETYAYRTRKYPIRKKEEIKCENLVK